MNARRRRAREEISASHLEWFCQRSFSSGSERGSEGQQYWSGRPPVHVVPLRLAHYSAEMA